MRVIPGLGLRLSVWAELQSVSIIGCPSAGLSGLHIGFECLLKGWSELIEKSRSEIIVAFGVLWVVD